MSEHVSVFLRGLIQVEHGQPGGPLGLNWIDFIRTLRASVNEGASGVYQQVYSFNSHGTPDSSVHHIYCDVL